MLRKFSRNQKRGDTPPIIPPEKSRVQPFGNTAAQEQKMYETSPKSSKKDHWTSTFSIFSTLVSTSEVFPNLVLTNPDQNESPRIEIGKTSEENKEQNLLSNNLRQLADSGISIEKEPIRITQSSEPLQNEMLQNEMRAQVKGKKSNRLSLENMGVLISSMYKCKGCDKLFKRKEILRAHYIRLHTNIFQSSCEECGEKFKLVYHLNQHKKLCHPKENVAKTLSSSTKTKILRKLIGSPTQKKKTLYDTSDLSGQNSNLSDRNPASNERICKICNKEYPSPYALRNHHIRMHTEEFKYPCKLCSKKYKLRKDFLDHKRRVHAKQISTETQPYSSDSDQEPGEIKSKEDSIEIVKDSVETHQVSTEVKNSVQASSKDLPPQKRRQRRDKQDLTCQICNKEFGRFYALKNHRIRMHTEESEHACKYCYRKFKLPKDLRSHIKKSHSKQSLTQTERVEIPSSSKVEQVTRRKELFICEVCGKEFVRKGSLQMHFNRIHSEKMHYTCAECGKEFKSKKDLSAHLRRIHQKRSPGQEKKGEFVCNICGIKVLRKGTLTIHHLRKHTHQFKFSCKLCGKNFKVQGDLTTHTRLRHLEPPAICEVCGKTCKNKHSLYVHQKYNHFQTQFGCPYCNKCYASQENLDHHVLTHENKERLTCSECGNTFASKTTLMNHLRCVHAQVKNFSCQVCAKLFPSCSRLRKHLITHTGKRLFVCEICGKQFKQKPSLISHRKKHPGEHPPLPIIRLDNALSAFIQK